MVKFKMTVLLSFLSYPKEFECILKMVPTVEYSLKKICKALKKKSLDSWEESLLSKHLNKKSWEKYQNDVIKQITSDRLLAKLMNYSSPIDPDLSKQRHAWWYKQFI
jgi:hypothetical protein